MAGVHTTATVFVYQDAMVSVVPGDGSPHISIEERRGSGDLSIFFDSWEELAKFSDTVVASVVKHISEMPSLCDNPVQP